jgi:hypothetical protein
MCYRSAAEMVPASRVVQLKLLVVASSILSQRATVLVFSSHLKCVYSL